MSVTRKNESLGDIEIGIYRDRYTLKELFCIYDVIESMVKKIREIGIHLDFYDDGQCLGVKQFDVYGIKGSTYRELDRSLSETYGKWLLDQEKKQGGKED